MTARAWRLVPLLGVALGGCPSEKTSPVKPVAKTCSIDLPSRSDWRLRADGTRFRDSMGRVVLLRGVNAGGRSKFAPFMPFDYAAGGFDAALAAYLDRAKAWGIDVIRVPFVWAAVEPNQGTDDPDFLKRYDALLDAAWARGIWTIVDFHQDIYSESFCGDGFPAWTIPPPVPAPHHDCQAWALAYFDDPNVKTAFDRFWAPGSTVQAAFVSLWDRMVARYKDKPGVLGFEIINEPSPGNAPDPPFSAATLTAFYSAMVPRIRAGAPSSLVFVDPPGIDGVGASTFLAKPAGDGIVFAPHFYPLVNDPMNIDMLMMGWANVGTSWNVPVLVGEFGATHDDSNQAANMAVRFDALDLYGLSGTEWEYSVAAESWNLESDSIVAADGTEYPVAKAVQRPFARAIAGDSPVTGFDTEKRVFTLTYAPADSGVTEVSMPESAFPKGYDLGLTGGCADTSHAGTLLVRSDAGAANVSLQVIAK